MLRFHKLSPIFLMLIFAAALMACSSTTATSDTQKPQVRFVTVTPQPPATPSTSVAQASSMQPPANQATGDISLRNVAPEIGLIFKHGAFKESLAADPVAMMGGGLCWLDIDNDGWLDLYVINSYALHEIPLWEAQGSLPRNALFHNNRNGTFEDISATSGADLALRGNGCTAADFNKDGWWDIYVTADGPNALLWNNGDGTFTEGAAAAGVAAPEWNSAAVVGDLNNDGWPDLFVAAYINLERKIPNPSGAFPQDYYGLPNHLYLSNGSPTADGSITFREVTAEAGLQKEERSLGAIFSDVDQDGDLDLYIANDGHPNRLYINEPTREAGGLGFKLVDMTASADAGDSGSGMGIAGGDYDGDGRVDLFITNWQTELNALYRNETAQQDNPLFQYSTYRIGISGLGNNKTAWGAAWVDLDQDTDLDLFIAHGKVPITDLKADAQLARLYRNRTWNNDGSAGQPGQFIEWTDQVGLNDIGPLMARGSAVADYDNDGDLDIAINTIGGALVLLQNNGPHGNWLQIKANGFYPGMKVKVELADGRQLVREWYSGSSYLASEDPRLNLGLGQADTVSRLEVDWPDGQTESWTDVAANQVWDLSMH